MTANTASPKVASGPFERLLHRIEGRELRQPRQLFDEQRKHMLRVGASLDHRERVVQELEKVGFKAKKAGG